MNSSVRPFRRRIASNLLWTPQGLVRHPVVTFYGERDFLVESCPAPDRLPATEFHAGLLVGDFPEDYRAAFERLRSDTDDLSTALPRVVVPHGIWVVLSGLDYAALRLTPHSRIQRL